MEQKQQGFTLVEIMVVVAITGLLASMYMPSFVKARGQTMRKRFVNDLRIAHAGFGMYAMDHGSYPTNAAPGEMPPGMAGYLDRMGWRAGTTMGGQWDWDRDAYGVAAGVSVYRPTESEEWMLKIDSLIDDGDLSTGMFRKRENGYIAIIEE